MTEPNSYQGIEYLVSDQALHFYAIAAVIGFAIGTISIIAKRWPSWRANARDAAAEKDKKNPPQK